jgi:catechol 2,3-dioxygenase-like lactoylglutathione lyase family enzyme
VAASILGILSVFLVCAGTGAGSWVAAALGVALGAAGLALYVISALNSREFTYVPGTANVQSCTPAPTSTQYGRCEMLLIVHAPGMDDVAVRVREPRVPVSKWPHEGSTLPILVAVTDRRRIKVLWDRVRSHGDGQPGPEPDEYPDEPTEVVLDDILDQEPIILDGSELDDLDGLGSDGLLPDGSGLDEDLSPGAGTVYLTLRDPAYQAQESEPGRDDIYRIDFSGDQESPEVDEAPGAREAIEVELSPVGQEAGSGEPGSSMDEGGRPSPNRRPSPRPRRPVHDEIDDGLDTGTLLTAGPLINPAEPPQPVVGPNEVVDLPDPLQVDNVVPVDPAVPAIPEQLSADDPGIADAYLNAAAPPGRQSGRSVQGVGVTLFVTDLARSIAFYRDTLGFSEVDEGLGSAVLESGDGRIVLRRVADMAPVDRRLVHLLLEVPDVQAAYEDLQARGVTFVHRPRAVSRYEQLELWSAAFRDPDGHGIALIRWEMRQPSTDRRTEST